MYNMLCQSAVPSWVFNLYIFHLYGLISCLSPLDEGNLEKKHEMSYQRCSESFSAADGLIVLNQINWDDGLTGVNAFIVEVEVEISGRYIWQKGQVPTTG